MPREKPGLAHRLTQLLPQKHFLPSVAELCKAAKPGALYRNLSKETRVHLGSAAAAWKFCYSKKYLDLEYIF